MIHVSSRRLLSGMLAALAVLIASAGLVVADNAGSNAGAAVNMVVVGHNALGGRGYNADVWVYNGYAYVGQSGDLGIGPRDQRIASARAALIPVC